MPVIGRRNSQRGLAERTPLPRGLVLTLEQCFGTLCANTAPGRCWHLVPTAHLGRCWHKVFQQQVQEVLEHIGDVLRASFCQDDVQKCSKLLKIARNRTIFVARFRSHANMCSNSVPTAALAGVRTLCQQQNQGRCWPTGSVLTVTYCRRSNVRTGPLGGKSGC